MFSLCFYTDYFFFISIDEVFNFRHKIYFFPTYYFKY